MKKFTKICLVTSLVLILTGGIVCIIGAAGGGWQMMNEMDRGSGVWRFVRRLENSYMLNWIDDMDVAEDIREEIIDVKNEVAEEVGDAWEDVWDDMDDTWDEAWESAEDAERNASQMRKEMEDAGNDISGIEQEFRSKVPDGDADIGIDASRIKEMKIDIGGAALCFMESENDNFGLKIDGNGDYRYYESKGVFYLEGGKKHLTDNHEKVYLYLPAGKKFDEVEINVGGGWLSVGELDAREVDLTVGAGMMTSGRISCQSLDVEVGAGEVFLEGIEADKIDLEVGMGTAYIKGKIGKEIDASCGMGMIMADLDNAETDFNYEIECEAGGITLGDKKYSAFADDIRVDNGAPGKCSLECSMGSIDVVFSK